MRPQAAAPKNPKGVGPLSNTCWLAGSQRLLAHALPFCRPQNDGETKRWNFANQDSEPARAMSHPHAFREKEDAIRLDDERGQGPGEGPTSARR